MRHLKRITIAILYVGICLFSWQIGRHCGVEKECHDLPTIEEIQQRIGAKVDGKLGPETQIKWQQAIDATVFNGYASEYFTENGSPRE